MTRRPFGRAELAVVEHKVHLVSARFRLSFTQRDELLSSVLESITLALRDPEKLRSIEEIGLFAYDTAQHRAIDLLAEDRRTISPYGDAVHPWLDAVRAHVRAQQPDDLGRVHLEAAAVADAIGQPGGAQGVGRCLSMLGFQLRQARRDGGRVRRWVWSP